MELVPAVSRQFKTVSTWIAASTILFDIAYIILDALNDRLDPETVVLINALLAAAIKIANLFKQNIPVTPDQKVELIIAAEETPLKETK